MIYLALDTSCSKKPAYAVLPLQKGLLCGSWQLSGCVKPRRRIMRDTANSDTFRRGLRASSQPQRTWASTCMRLCIFPHLAGQHALHAWRRHERPVRPCHVVLRGKDEDIIPLVTSPAALFVARPLSFFRHGPFPQLHNSTTLTKHLHI